MINETMPNQKRVRYLPTMQSLVIQRSRLIKIEPASRPIRKTHRHVINLSK
jgi:hypothetical protein